MISRYHKWHKNVIGNISQRTAQKKASYSVLRDQLNKNSSCTKQAVTAGKGLCSHCPQLTKLYLLNQANQSGI